MSNISFLLAIALTFNLIAATMAFLITYNEYSCHIYMDKRKALKIAIEAALFVFLFFSILSVVAVFVLNAAL